MDFVRSWSEKTGVAQGRMLPWLSLGSSTFYDGRRRYGKVNEHNAWLPRDHWLEDWEKQAIIAFFRRHPLKAIAD